MSLFGLVGITDERGFYNLLLLGFFALPLIILPVLFLVSAPYGRHARGGWGPQINATLGWVVMEAPSPLVFGYCAWLGRENLSPATVTFLVLWELHYLHRAFVFPFRRRGGQQNMPAFIALNAILFNSINGYLNGRYLFHFAPEYPAHWLTEPRFLVGVLLFFAGFAINFSSDEILRNLRAPGETGYKIPRGGFYRYVTAPNYFGEIVEWSGFALATFSLSGVAFVVWTIANLLPRARSNHRWYLEKFPDYPKERKAVIPFVY